MSDVRGLSQLYSNLGLNIEDGIWIIQSVFVVGIQCNITLNYYVNEEQSIENADTPLDRRSITMTVDEAFRGIFQNFLYAQIIAREPEFSAAIPVQD